MKKKNHFKSKALLFCSHLVTSLHINVNVHPCCGEIPHVAAVRTMAKATLETVSDCMGTKPQLSLSRCSMHYLANLLPNPIGYILWDSSKDSSTGHVLQHQGYRDITFCVEEWIQRLAPVLWIQKPQLTPPDSTALQNGTDVNFCLAYICLNA